MPMIILAMAVLSFLTYQNSKALINREIDNKMRYQLSSTAEHIQTELTAHLKIPQTLARAMEATGDHIEQETVIDMIMKYLSTNNDTFGVGVWFEANQFKSYVNYFGPYAYRYNGQVLYTLDYSTKEYNYLNRDWYLIGKDTDQSVVWTKPYFDENSKSAVLTTTAPFYHFNGDFRGVVTANIDLKNLQKMISSIEVGISGRAFLVDSEGTYIADRDEQKLLKINVSQDPNASLANAGQTMIKKESGYTTYEDTNGLNRIYYMDIPVTGWKLAMVIPEKELYEPLKQLLMKSVIIIGITLFIVSFVIYWFARYMRNQIRAVNVLSSDMASGDLTRSIEVRSRDEFGSMAQNLNLMTRQLNEVIKKITSGVEMVAGTSDQLTSGTEQTTKAAEEIAGAAQSVAAGSEQQAHMVNKASDKVDETSAGLKNMAERMTVATEASRMTLQTAVEGKESIQSAVRQIHIMDEKVQHAAQIIESLTAKSKKVDESMELIGKLVAQTRILSLNAGITAVQAGAHGRAFTVIAEEIRSLAENAAKAGHSIQETIAQMQSEVRLAKEQMDSNRDAVRSGKTKIEHAGTSFERIVQAAQDVTVETEGAVSSITEMHMYMSEMEDAIKKITVISMETANQTVSVSAAAEEQMASMQEMTAAAHTLASLANDMKDLISRFSV